MTYSPAVLRLADAISKAVDPVPNAQPLHGTDGALTWPAIEPGIVNAMPSARSGIDALLAVRSSNMLNPLFAVLSGLTESTGQNPTAPCLPGKQPGDWTFCTSAFPWGRLVATSRIIQVDQVAWRLNRGDFVDHRLLGNPFAQAPTVREVNQNSPLRNVVDSEMAKLYYAFYRDNAYMTHHGDYSAYQTTVGGSTGHYEYDGLDRIIRTGRTDVLTGVACPNVDSKIEDMAGAEIAANGQAYVDVMTDLIHYVMHKAESLRLNPVQWAWTGPDAALRELSKIWPCAYNTVSCGNGVSQITPNINPQLRDQQDDFYKNKYLLFDGMRIPWVTDDTLTQSTTVNGNGTTTFTFRLKLVPLTSPVLTDSGGQITYKERFNFNTDSGGISTQTAIDMLMPNAKALLLDGGTTLMLTDNEWECVQVKLIRYERLVCRATMLAASLDNVSYTPRYIDQSAFPGGPGYNDAGFTVSPVPTYPLS